MSVSQKTILKSPLFIIAMILIAAISFLSGQKYWERTKGTLSNNSLNKPSMTSQPHPTSVPTPRISISAQELSTWKTHTDIEIGYSIKYPEDMLPTDYNCNPFDLPSSDKERKMIENIRSSHHDIGYRSNGLRVIICIIGKNPDRQNAKQASGGGEVTTFMGIEAYRSVSLKHDSITFDTPDNRIMSISGGWGDIKYRETFYKMLSTFDLVK